MKSISAKECYNKTITDIALDENKLKLTLDDGRRISIWDNRQCCCENRYMQTDDDINSLIGGKIIHIETKDGPEIKEAEFDIHEQVFVEVATDKGLITLANHNEHNGYYGGFDLIITEDLV